MTGYACPCVAFNRSTGLGSLVLRSIPQTLKLCPRQIRVLPLSCGSSSTLNDNCVLSFVSRFRILSLPARLYVSPPVKKRLWPVSPTTPKLGPSCGMPPEPGIRNSLLKRDSISWVLRLNANVYVENLFEL